MLVYLTCQSLPAVTIKLKVDFRDIKWYNLNKMDTAQPLNDLSRIIKTSENYLLKRVRILIT